jgi:hypothetical protein
MGFSQPPFQSGIVDRTAKVVSVWGQWFQRVQLALQALTGSGATADIPTQNLYVGQPYYDTTQGQLLIWNGNTWASVGSIGTGTTSQFPSNPFLGQLFFATDAGQIFNWNGTGWHYVSSGFCGQFYDTTDHVAGVIVTPYLLTFNTPDISVGVSCVGSQIAVAFPGFYRFQLTAQLINQDATITDSNMVNLYLHHNGSKVTYSDRQYTVPFATAGLEYGYLSVSFDYILFLNAGDVVEYIWQTTNTQVYLGTIPGTDPSTPSAFLTVTQC